jgi:hypothetical protein
MAQCNIKKITATTTTTTTTTTAAAVIKGKGEKEIIMPAAALKQDLRFELLMAVTVQ